MAGSTTCTSTPFNTAVLTTTVIFVCLATVAVLLKFLATHKADGKAWHRADTWLVVSALVLCYGYLIQTICACALTGVNCYRSDVDTAWAEREVMKILWTDLFLLIPASALVKIGVLEYFKRMFLSARCQWLCNVTIFLCSAWAISAIFAQAFSSTPIQKSWNPEATRSDLNYDYPAFTLAIFGINIVLDFIILCLPIPLIVRFHMPAPRLAKVVGVFTFGFFCLVCCIMKLYYADRRFSITNPSMPSRARAQGRIALWGRMEPAASVVAACIPTFGPLICSPGTLLEKVLSASSVFSSRGSRSSSRVQCHGDMPTLNVQRASSATITRHTATFNDPSIPHHHVSIHSTSRPTSLVAVPGQISVEYEVSVDSRFSRVTEETGSET